MASHATFTQFRQLPDGIRIMIWREAMQRGDRFVLMCIESRRIIPRPGNQYSPLLATCHESRELFRAAHPLRLPVFDLKKWSDPREDPSTGSEEGLDNLRSGAIYLNPATDMFVFNADLDDIGCEVFPPPPEAYWSCRLPRFFTRFLEPEIRIQVSRTLFIIRRQLIDSSQSPQVPPLPSCFDGSEFPGVISCFHFYTWTVRIPFTDSLVPAQEVPIWQKLTRGIMGQTDLDIERGDMGCRAIKCGSSSLFGPRRAS